MTKRLLLLLLLWPLMTIAQDNRLYTTQHGLATSNINSLTLDSHGLLWVASNAQLAFFDGAGFHYLPNINTATGQPYYTLVNRIYEDKDNHYWLLTNFGLYYYDALLNHYERILVDLNENEQHGYSITQLIDLPGNPREKIVVTSGYGLYYLDCETHKINTAKSEALKNVLRANFIVKAYIDSQSRLWASSINMELICVDLKQNKRLHVDLSSEAEEKLRSLVINDMQEVQKNKALYMTTDDGVLKYNYETQRVEVLSQTIGGPYTQILHTRQGKVLFGTDSRGVWQLGEGEKMETFALDHRIYDLSMAKVRDLVEDKEGNLIFALHQRGIFIIPQRNETFRYHCLSAQGNGKNTSCITSLQIDKEGNYWIATDGAGVFTTDGTHMNTAHTVNNGLRSLLIQAICLDKHDNVWIASYGGGVQYYDKAAARFVTPDWLNSIRDVRVLGLAIDKEKELLFIGTSGKGVYVADMQARTINKLEYSERNGQWITTLYVDPDHTLWIAEVGAVGYFNLNTGAHGELKREHSTQAAQCISSSGSGKNKRILIGSDKGLIIYNPLDGKSEVVLPGIPIMSINETEKNYWVASLSGLYAIDKKTHETMIYNSLGGYFMGEFHRGATLNNRVGNLLYGCDNGIICFTPDAVRTDSKLNNEIYFTSLEVTGKEVLYNDSTSIMDTNILYAKQLNLSHKQNTFVIYFNLPNFGLSHQIHYEYLLDGYEDYWHNCPDISSQRASYANLPSGNYTLRVKAYLEGTPESMIEKELRIHIDAPWYDTTFAHLVYLFLFFAMAYFIYRYSQSRKLHEAELQEARHNDEIKEAKLRLFTSITHELRTPLTMIVSPIRQLMLNAKDDATRSALTAMKHNCDRLLNTVKQITDMRKIDAGQFDLHFEEVDLCEYTHNVAQSFMGAATSKHINFSIENIESTISVWIDPIHFEKVLVNILSNAFKFCPEGGRILIRNVRKGDSIQLSIFNGGSHINEQDMAHIFERFYQSEEGQKHVGSGIGLNLAYELVQLHHAQITCENIEPDGVEFTISIPSGFSHLSAKELEPRPTTDETAPSTNIESEQTEEENNQQSIMTHVETIHSEAVTNEGTTEEQTDKDLPTLLIVDDSKELCEYLHDQLCSDYNIMLAFGGNSAWNIILQSRPDLIITDMNMPDGDGIELCRRVKSNPEFDHTPIIMLTGEGNESVQLQSLSLHVDHYIQKPFNMTILQGTIKQVLDIRENLKRHIQRKDLSNDYQSVELPSAEDQLFERINEMVLKHLDDDEFGVQELANEVGISRVHLNRKMKEKYGLSPNVFIKTYRLKQAAYLLLHKRVNVSEVAYRVGFSTHSYFSSSFRDFFGMAPKAFIDYYSDPENAKALDKILQ